MNLEEEAFQQINDWRRLKVLSLRVRDVRGAERRILSKELYDGVRDYFQKYKTKFDYSRKPEWKNKKNIDLNIESIERGKMKPPSITKSAYNLSENDIFLLGALGRRASNSYLRGQVQDSYFFTEELRYVVDYFLSQDEADQLDNLENKISKIYSLLKKSQRVLEDYEDDDEKTISFMEEKINKIKDLHSHYVKNYRKMMRKFMSRYGLLFKEKEDYTRIT